MPAPEIETVVEYLGDENSWTSEQVQAAFLAEKDAQAAVCSVPGDDDPWPEDLAEALCRRVAANLANRSLPLGVQASMSEAAVSTVRVGGGDREVRRLEGPYRKRLVG